MIFFLFHFIVAMQTMHETRNKMNGTKQRDKPGDNECRPSVCVVSGECMCATETNARSSQKERRTRTQHTERHTMSIFTREKEKKRKKEREMEREKERKNSVTYHKFIDFFLISFRFFFVSYAVIYGMSSETFMANGKKEKRKW